MLALLHANCADQNRLTLLKTLCDVIDNRLVLRLFGAKDQIAFV